MEFKKETGSSYASEAGHWYKLDGTPSYTTTAKDGSERPYTLRDARKDKDRVPSVTTILKVAANEGLNKWLKSNLLMAAATLPRVEGESADEWIKRVTEDAQRQSQEAAALGTSIHASLEKAYEGEHYAPEHTQFVVATMNAIEKCYPSAVWDAEKSFAHAIGFGGKVDLSSYSGRIVIDFKTSAFDEDKKDVGGYDEHLMQLAAYSHGLGIENPYCANVYVSTTVPGLIKVKEWTAEEIERGWQMFKAILRYWQVKNKYEVSL